MDLVGETRWLSNDEIEAWRPLAALMLLLPSRLEEPLQAYGLTFFEYSVLVVLSDAGERTAPMSEIAHLAGGSLSRTSHSARRLEQRGLLQRSRCPTDGRVTLVTLTDRGHQLLVEAAPSHVESVRQAIFDALTPQQAQQLGQHVTAILTNFAPTGPWAEETNNATPERKPVR
ncbi:MAG: MarR family transcriptional regulator [Actinomycetota bacterium]